ncbi:2Fe-2S iron-sulfur cluster binding domain protein [Pseudoroseomonas cervicalis ATCC 49957]|uniref:2Fe-2S iron-sulfur cluster binding domain protein n=2 Tax=Teichococcus cervicalis TaxID=204525 RepID=D5RGP3_9PROT|nr:2Fe-2S iron-sulfur cluster binding domain protein [Pseudoroseomonas cervicalis ATCC 49957]
MVGMAAPVPARRGEAVARRERDCTMDRPEPQQGPTPSPQVPAERVRLTIDGEVLEADATASILQAAARGGAALTANIGCMGQGVCGSCRCMVRREGERAVETRLACETRVEPGMQVSFIDYFVPERQHDYQLEALGEGWALLDALHESFPEAAHCRHCSGCDRACPKGLAVQKGVELSVEGDFAAAAAVFDECVMCNLCTLACPEHIRPNHLGLFVRRSTAALTLRPIDLVRRLREIERGEMRVVLPDTGPEGAA